MYIRPAMPNNIYKYMYKIKIDSKSYYKYLYALGQPTENLFYQVVNDIDFFDNCICISLVVSRIPKKKILQNYDYRDTYLRIISK